MEARQAGAAGQELSRQTCGKWLIWETAWDPARVPDLRAGSGQAQRWSLHWVFLLGIKGLDESMLTTAPGMWWGELRGERRAVPAMGRAAPTLLALLSLTATISDAQDTCPGEWGTNPTAIPLRQPISSPTHKKFAAGGGDRIWFFSFCAFFNSPASGRRVRGRMKSQQPLYKTADSNRRCSILPRSPVGCPGTGCPSQGFTSWLRIFVHGALAQLLKDAEQYKGLVKCLLGARHPGSLGRLHSTAFCLYSWGRR